MTKSTKTERKKLDTDILKLWSLCVRTKQRQCQICGSDYRLQAHHIIGRAYKRGRYDLSNGLCICSGCHFKEKTRPEEFRDLVIGAIGQERFDDLKAWIMLDGSSHKVTVEDLKIEKQHLKNELNRLEHEWGKL
ncbi:MAG: HNH endonuclease [Limnochordia bacterium]|nr:HNH endonuclease [Limnochordia bacterium]